MASGVMSVWDQPSASDWNLENGYKIAVNESSYPVRVYSAKKSSALDFMLLSMKEEVEYMCRVLEPGFKLFFHTPGDVIFPHAWSPNAIEFRVPFSGDVKISITPKYITTAPALRTYRPEQRNCFFNSERRLRFFNVYSENNCRAECLANYTLNECGCVKFSMPSIFCQQFNNTKFSLKTESKSNFLVMV